MSQRELATVTLTDTRTGRTCKLVRKHTGAYILHGDENVFLSLKLDEELKEMKDKLLAVVPQPKEREKKKFKKINNIKQFLKK